jgi:hypothetical protein
MIPVMGMAGASSQPAPEPCRWRSRFSRPTPTSAAARTVIVLSRHPERLRTWLRDVEPAGETSCGDCMPYENHLPIWICRRPLTPLAQRWPDLKHYE